MDEASPRRVPAEILALWALFAAVGIAIVVTYSRVPVDELYHVSRGGLVGGASRLLVYSSFPLALAMLPILALLVDRWPERGFAVIAGVAAICSALIFWPGVVSEAD